MAKKSHPRRGSLQFWPRVRARRWYATLSNWPKNNNVKLLGFAGYKAGMTHILIKDNSNSTTKGDIVSIPVTILECPPLKVYSIRFYKENINKGKYIIGEVFNKKIDKELKRKISPGKKENEPKDFDSFRLIVYTQPSLTGLKKTPEIFEVALGGSKEEGLNYAKELMNKEIKINDVFSEGQYMDVHSVTKGKGFQGTVKRFGVPIRQHKSEKTKRGIGTLGPWHPKHVRFTVPQSGKMGNHQRTEYNKWLMKIGSKPEDINPAGGFLHYGTVKKDYIIVKGSISGERKRLIIMTEAMRPTRKPMPAEINYTSLESKQ